jgi:F-type H+-transporting ATPase subunit delta
MFPADRWALAFTGVCGADAGAGLEALRRLGPWFKGIPGAVSGSAAAARLGRAIAAAREKSGAGPDFSLEFAVRLLMLLVKRDQVRHIDAVIREVQAVLDRQGRVLTVTVEAAFPLKGDFTETLKDGLRRRTGAAEIRLVPRIVPELLGGYRLRMGSEVLDGSLRGQLRKMARDLRAAPIPGEEPIGRI